MNPSAWRLYVEAVALIRTVVPTDAGWTRVLFTGARQWSKQRDDILPYLEATLLAVAAGVPDGERLTLVHGGADGGDRLWMRLAHEYHIQQSVYPVNAHEYASFGFRAPLVRDKRMVAHGAVLTVGAPHPQSKTGGTWHTMRLSLDAGIPTLYLTNGVRGWRLVEFRPRRAGQAERLF